jgi:hypothetical protein
MNDTTPPARPKRPALRKKAASLVEAGMVMGLIGVVSIGAVLSTGTSVERIICTTESALVRAMGWGEGTCVGEADNGGGGSGGGEGTGGTDPGGGGGSGGGEGTGGTDPDSGGGQGGGNPPPVETNPFEGIVLQGITYPQNTFNRQIEIAALPANHGVATRLTTTTDEGDAFACYQEGGQLQFVCSLGTIDVPASASALGYAFDMPADPRTDFVRALDATLARTSNGNVLRTWTDLPVSRTPTATVLTLSTTFSDVVFDAGRSAAYTEMQPLEGTALGTLTLRTTTSDSGFRPCIRSTTISAITCSTGNSMTVPNTAYAIGYRLDNLPADPRVVYAYTNGLQLSSALDPTNPVSWPIDFSRPAEPIELDFTNGFVDQTFPQGTTGVQTTLIPVNGNGAFNGPMQYRVSGGGSNVGSCVQAVEGGPINCKSTGDTTTHTITPDTYAIGYRVNLPADTKAAFNAADTSLSIASTLDTNVSETFTIGISRTAEPVIINATSNIAGFHLMEAGQETLRVMVPLTGTFNDTMTLMRPTESAPAGTTWRVCRQSTPASSVACSTSAAPYTDITAATHAIGWEVTNTNTTATFPASLTLRLRSNTAPTTVQDFAISIKRKTVLNIAFNNTTVPASTTSGYTDTQRIAGQWYDNGVNMRAEITHVSGPHVSLCTETTSTSTPTCGTATSPTNPSRLINLSSSIDEIGFRVSNFGAPGTTQQAVFNLVIYSTAEPGVRYEWNNVTITRPAS